MRDLQHVLRHLGRHPVRTVVVVLTFGLTLGLNSAIFSLVKAVLLQPLPFADADRLVMVWAEFLPQGQLKGRLSEPELYELRESGTFERLAMFSTFRVNLTGDGPPEQVEAAGMTFGLLPLLGLGTVVGRDFLPEEDRPGAPGTVLLSHGFWGRRFASDRSVIGRTLTLDGKPYTIIGVLPPEIELLEKAEIWLPLRLDPLKPTERGTHYLKAIGRLAAGKSLEQAGAELTSLGTRLQERFPKNYPPPGSGWRLRPLPLVEEQTGEIRPALLILLSASAFVVLIACVNIANLWIGDVWGRRKDFAVQAAFGASRGLILRQLLLQSTVLSLLGGVLGLFLAQWSLRLVLLSASASNPRLREVSIDFGVFAFTLALSLLVGLLAGLIPALQASVGVANTLREASGRASQSVRSRWLRGLLVAGEVALALVVVVGAGLLLKNLLTLYREPMGFHPAGVLTASLSLPAAKYSSEEQLVAFYDELIRQNEALPGVEAASVVSQLPLSGRKYSGGFSVEGVGEEDLEALRCAVGPSYFQVMGIPLLQGRAFSARDRAASPGVVIIDETLARRFWPRGDAVGKRLKRGRMDSDRPWLTVVGVVANVKSEALDADALPQMYFPYTQLTLPQMFVVLQSPQGDPVQLADAVRSTVLRLDGEQPVAMIQSMDEYLSSSLRRQRFLTLLLTTFALLGLTLAVLGIYAVMSSFVTERTYEVAIRMALGAQPREVLRMLFRQSMLLGVAGITAGLAGTLLLAPALASQLYHLSPLDPLVYLLASALLLSAVFFAAYVPARKAVRVDPVISLRHS